MSQFPHWERCWVRGYLTPASHEGCRRASSGASQDTAVPELSQQQRQGCSSQGRTHRRSTLQQSRMVWTATVVYTAAKAPTYVGSVGWVTHGFTAVGSLGLLLLEDIPWRKVSGSQRCSGQLTLCVGKIRCFLQALGNSNASDT